MPSAQRKTVLVIPVAASDERWVLDDEETMPESALHDLIAELIALVLRAWVARKKRDAMVGRNLAIRWDRARPTHGVDPDVYLAEPAPPEGEKLASLCLWKKGHTAPRVAVEVVSERTAEKDYTDGPERHGACGTRELWVFDPLKLGPSPAVLQVWRRTGKGTFERVYKGDGPAYSRELRAWLVVTDDGSRLRISDDAPGRALWPTRDEEERAEKERERAERALEQAGRTRAESALARERRARLAAEAELARLRALHPAPASPSPSPAPPAAPSPTRARARKRPAP